MRLGWRDEVGGRIGEFLVGFSFCHSDSISRLFLLTIGIIRCGIRCRTSWWPWISMEEVYWFRRAVFRVLGTVSFESREWSASFASATPSIAFQALKSASLAEAFDKD